MLNKMWQWHYTCPNCWPSHRIEGRSPQGIVDGGHVLMVFRLGSLANDSTSLPNDFLGAQVANGGLRHPAVESEQDIELRAVSGLR